jgi:methylated-DNA-protein-cysteine methyltransferase related protein
VTVLSVARCAPRLKLAKPDYQTSFVALVAKVVKSIPKGTTASYSQVALMAQKPGAARAVVRALHAAKDIPWWRVVRSDGTLAIEVAVKQAKLLRAEGVKVLKNRIVK